MIGFDKFNMEEIFAITFSVATAIGVAIGVLVYLIFDHDNKEN